MLEGLREVNAAAVLFARLFYGQRSEYMWEDDLGEIHTISQGDGGEQGDAMMPLLFSLGQHRAHEEAARRLTPGEHLLAFLDDTFFVSPPHRAGRSTTSLRCLCGGTQASESTWARHSCGIVQEPGPLCAIVWRGPLKLSTPTPECGGDLCCHRRTASHE